MQFLIDIWKQRAFRKFLVVFLLTFALLYYGSLAIIGLTWEGGRYSPFLDKYFNVISWLRSSLMWGTRHLLAWFGVETYMANPYNIRQVGGRGIKVVYECVGYGVMSFWTAFVLASAGNWKQKLTWVLGGNLALWVLNIFRFALLLVATNKGWPIPLGWDHHTWFNLIAYLAIFGMILWHQRTVVSATKPNRKV